MEQYLQSYVSYQQDDYVKWLPMPEFVANNHKFSATKTTLCLANYDFHPWITLSVRPADRLPQ